MDRKGRTEGEKREEEKLVAEKERQEKECGKSIAGQRATTRYFYVVCIYGAICLQILFLKHHILLFCHEISKYFA